MTEFFKTKIQQEKGNNSNIYIYIYKDLADFKKLNSKQAVGEV